MGGAYLGASPLRASRRTTPMAQIDTALRRISSITVAPATTGVDVDRTLKMAAVVWQLEGNHVYLCHCVIAARFANALNALHPTPARWQAICV